MHLAEQEQSGASLGKHWLASDILGALCYRHGLAWGKQALHEVEEDTSFHLEVPSSIAQSTLVGQENIELEGYHNVETAVGFHKTLDDTWLGNKLVVVEHIACYHGSQESLFVMESLL